MKYLSRLFSISLLIGTSTIFPQLSAFSETSPQQKEIGFSVNNIDTSISPKDDFYHFAVGNWLKKAVIPDDKTKVDSFSEVFDQNSLKIQKIMDDAAAKSSKFPIQNGYPQGVSLHHLQNTIFSLVVIVLE